VYNNTKTRYRVELRRFQLLLVAVCVDVFYIGGDIAAFDQLMACLLQQPLNIGVCEYGVLLILSYP